jgi:integrase
MSLHDAILAHMEAKEQHLAGMAPGTTTRDVKTVSELAEMFYKYRIVPHRRRPEQVRCLLDKEILPAIGRVKLRTLNTGVIRDMVARIVHRGSPATAGKVLAIAKQLCRYGQGNAYMESNPALPLEEQNLGITHGVGSDHLKDADIPVFWDATESLDPHMRAALCLLLLLGIRSSELRLTRWDDVDLEAGTLTVPVENQKLTIKGLQRGRPFVVPLPTQAVKILRELPRVSGWAFPGRLGDKPVNRRTISASMQRLGLPYTAHGLRKTLRTGLGKLGVPRHVSEACLNHVQPGMDSIYDMNTYRDERREALQQWADRMELLVNPRENVTLLGVG